jgi:hypothetical protein
VTTGPQTLQDSYFERPGHHCERPRPLHFESLKLLNWDFNADPVQLFTLNTNPDPASKRQK